MSDYKYTKDHEWARMEGDVCVVGITPYAQNQLGDVVFVELPVVGKKVAKGDEVAVVESVKAASEIYAPVTGEIIAVNEALPDDPGKVNADPLGKGWFFKIKPTAPTELDGLLNAAQYKELTGE